MEGGERRPDELVSQGPDNYSGGGESSGPGGGGPNEAGYTLPEATAAASLAADTFGGESKWTGEEGREVEDPRRALRQELQKRRPAVFRLRKICRDGLGGKIPADLRSDVWQLLLGVESKDRFLLDDSIRDTNQDLENQRVIRVDAQRTRAGVAAFRTPEMELLVSKLLTFYCKRKAIRYKQGLNEVLAPFIMLRQDPGLPDGTVFNLFYAFIDRFLPHMYVQEEFHALQCTFRLFRLALLYHDPELCAHLDTHCMSPELYATPWFLTMFARQVPLVVLYKLWDLYLLEDDDRGSQLNVFVALALMLENRQGLINSDPSDLPIFVTGVLGSGVESATTPSATADGKTNGSKNSGRTSSAGERDTVVVTKEALQCSPLPSKVNDRPVGTGGSAADLPDSSKILSLVDSLDDVIARAQHLRKTTPVLMCETFSKAVMNPRHCPSAKVLERLEAQPFVLMSAKQLVAMLTAKKQSREMMIRVIDCRSRACFEESHLVGAVHLDPELLEFPDLLVRATEALKTRCASVVGSHVETHVVFVSDNNVDGSAQPSSMAGVHGTTNATVHASGIDQTCTVLALYAIQRGLGRVCAIEGGWDAIAATSGIEFILEHGASIDQLLEEPISKSRSTTLDSLKDAIKIDTFKDALGMIGGLGARERNASNSSASEILDGSESSQKSPTWLQKIGKSFATKDASPGRKTPPPSTASPVPVSHTTIQQQLEDEEHDQQKQRSVSFLSRVVNKVKTMTPDLSNSSSFSSENSSSSKDASDGLLATGDECDECDPDAGWIDLRLWRSASKNGKQSPRDELHFYPARPVDNADSGMELNHHGAKNHPLLAISPGYILLLQPHPERANFAHIEQKWMLGDLLKITSKKSVENLVIFHFKDAIGNQEAGNDMPMRSSFIVDGSRQCIELVKKNYTLLLQ